MSALCIFVQISCFLIGNAASQFHYPHLYSYEMPAQESYFPPPDITGHDYPDSIHRGSKHHHDGVYYEDSEYWWHYFKFKKQGHTYSDESVEYSDPDEGSKDCECNCEKCSVERDPCCHTTCQSCGFPPNPGVIVVPYPYPIILSAHPEKTKEEPSKTTAKPRKITTNPSKTTAKPPKTTAIPLKLTLTPPKTTATTPKLTSTPSKLTSTPPKITATPPITTVKTLKAIVKTLKSEAKPPKEGILSHTTKKPCKSTLPIPEFITNVNEKLLEHTTCQYTFSPCITRFKQNNVRDLTNPGQLRDEQNDMKSDIIFKTPRKGKSDGKYVVSSLKNTKRGWIPKYGIVPIPDDMAKKLLNQLPSVKALKKETNKKKYRYERILRSALKYYIERDLDAHNPLKRYQPN